MIDFGTGGFRGVIADTFTKANIQKIAQGIANVIKEKKSKTPFVIGYDYRFMSDKAAIWVAEVLVGNGIKVLLSDQAVPTPAVMYKTKQMNNDFGAMITASHNPYIFNGIKVFQKEGMDADVALTSKIEQYCNNLDCINVVFDYESKFNKNVKKINFLDEYLLSIDSFISPLIKNNNIKILFDAIYGTGSISLSKMSQIYRLANFVTINGKHDTMFGGMMPNPTEENMLKNRDLVLKEGYELTIGIDSDGDRLGVLDEQGNYINSNEILAALYYYLVKYRNEKGDCVKNCATSNLLDNLAHKLGFKCHEVDVGFKNISSKIKETSALIGGESSGGLTIRNYLYGKDSTFAAMLFIEMVCIMNKKVSEIIKEVKEFADFDYSVIEHTINYHENIDIKKILYNSDPKFDEMPKEIRRFSNNVKYIFDNDEWLLLRLSGTEPVIRVFVEMKNEIKAKKYLKVLEKYIKNMEKEECLCLISI